MTAQAQASRTIAAEPDQVWKTLTSKAGMKAYMMGADVTTDWQVGHPITMRGDFKGKPFEDKGEVRSFEPGRRLSYTHETSAAPGQTHLVSFELAPAEGGGTRVTVTQAPDKGVDAATDEKNKAMYEKTWAAMLESLEQAATH